MCSLESPHRGDSNEYTQYTIFNMKKKNTLNYPKSAAMGFFSKGFKNEFETAVVNEPSVFEPPKFYCSRKQMSLKMFPLTLNVKKTNYKALNTSLPTDLYKICSRRNIHLLHSLANLFALRFLRFSFLLFTFLKLFECLKRSW